MATTKTTKAAATKVEAPKADVKATKDAVKTTTKAAAKTENTTETKTEVKAEAKKATTAKKAATATKKTATTKKAAEKKNEIFIQFAGFEFSHDELLEKVKADYIAQTGKKTITSKKLYVKPEDMKVYYVINDKFMGDVVLA